MLRSIPINNKLKEYENMLLTVNIIPSITCSDNTTIKIWDNYNYECIQTIQDAFCNSSNGLLKLNSNTFILGGNGVIKMFDIETYQINQFKDESLEGIYCLYANESIFIGNDEGEIMCCNLSSNQIIFKSKFHNDRICCIIKDEDNKLISRSEDNTINIYIINTILMYKINEIWKE